MEIVEDFSCESIFSFFFHHFSSFFRFFHFLHFYIFSFIFFHFLSFSFIFFHFLSFSFIFFHFLSVYSQNLIFWGLNFVTISLDSSYAKINFCAHLGWYTLSALFSFFSYFFPPFFVFSFFFFLIFCSFLHFLMFFIFHFSEEQVSSFLPASISFKYVLMLALVSEFNCFLRSRCSMEMWCPDDLGRDSWDWVGPPAWERACFNSLEWCGGSSPVKTRLSVLVCSCLFLSVLVCSCLLLSVIVCYCLLLSSL